MFPIDSDTATLMWLHIQKEQLYCCQVKQLLLSICCVGTLKWPVSFPTKHIVRLTGPILQVYGRGPHHICIMMHSHVFII